jgi:hypothetical protein
VQNKDRLLNKSSRFRSNLLDRPYENSATYENSMRPNRIDTKIFSVYKLLEEPKGIASDYTGYVDGGYVANGYVKVYDKFNP